MLLELCENCIHKRLKIGKCHRKIKSCLGESTLPPEIILVLMITHLELYT